METQSSQTATQQSLNFDSMNIGQFVNLIPIDAFNKQVAVQHYSKVGNKSFEGWYESLEKDGVTLPDGPKRTRETFGQLTKAQIEAQQIAEIEKEEQAKIDAIKNNSNN